MRARKQFSNAYGISLTRGSHLEILALLVCMEIVIAFSAVGFIQIAPISVTTLSILVIIAAMYFGPLEGTALSLVFAAVSIWKASLTSVEEGDIIFSPFLSGKPLQSIIMSVGSRVFFALAAGLLFRWWFSKERKYRKIGISVIAVVSTGLHALLVYLCMIVFFRADQVSTTSAFDTSLLISNSILYVVTVLAALLADYLMRHKAVKHFFEVISEKDVKLSKNQKRAMIIFGITLFLVCLFLGLHFMSRITGYFSDRGDIILQEEIAWTYALLVQLVIGFAATFGIIALLFRWMQKYFSSLTKASEDADRIREELIQNNARIFALEDDFESLYDVEIKSGNYISYVKGDFYQSNVIEKLVSPTDYFEDLRANIDAVIFAEDRDGLYEVLTREGIRDRLAAADHFDYYYRVNTENGPIWFKIRIVYKNSEKKNVIIGVFNASKDVEAQQIEEQNAMLKEAREAAEAANQAKSAFLFNMSHDIRTPMNAILGYTNVGLRHAGDAERSLDSFKKIKMAGGHLLNLINDILEMSRIESGNLELAENPVDIRNTIENVNVMSQALAIPKSINFETVTGELKNPYVYSDELHINEVLINIISNAVKYTNNGGKVTFSVSQISDIINGKVNYRFEVADNGIGMSEEFQRHLFEAFSREATSTVSRTEGAGLGLSIVKRILDLAGGTISVKSKPGEGSVFTIEMPFMVMDDSAIDEFIAKAEADSLIREDISLEGKKVLLVEDNAMNREIASDILTEAGLAVETAEDGEIAVKTVLEKGVGYYDFILMDIQMPIMNGYEATKAIRALPNGDTIPIIALSANAFEEDRQKSFDMGMNAHVAKPIDVKTLFETMHSIRRR